MVSLSTRTGTIQEKARYRCRETGVGEAKCVVSILVSVVPEVGREEEEDGVLRKFKENKVGGSLFKKWKEGYVENQRRIVEFRWCQSAQHHVCACVCPAALITPD